MSFILAFAGSNSSASINFELVKYTCSLIGTEEVRLMNMSNCPFPMYSMDYEKEHGYSNALNEFKRDIQFSKGVIISVNEHNSYPSAYFKNLLDWLSRLDRDFIRDKKVLLMATSPGKRGGIGALEVSSALLKRFGAHIVGTFSLPQFKENFDAYKGIVDADLAQAHQNLLKDFLKVID
ncbi:MULTISPECIES: NADPH-dependent FMN reductase [Maribacter]|uniref:NAD(P)H-dependent oxidoreductase n=1 Tax=Maribacter flavus TaxID=1658664 RepID=A0ABU7IJN2_9FLAO|nr:MULTISPECIES: NAD(P)H-dependent oxidoreductase [Maribacter]MDC6405860.1 NAD(P)H-dependent oxidoreductase [Maribacter sp. PR66]MEE1972888.1 NAD(P)H-dependent oxidoreductase [Maribacter flavus]